VQEWYVEQVRAAEKVGEEARAKLKTKADAEAYIRGVCDKIAKCFGEFPEKTPLNRDTYTIEKVIFVVAAPATSSPRTSTSRRERPAPGCRRVVWALPQRQGRTRLAPRGRCEVSTRTEGSKNQSGLVVSSPAGFLSFTSHTRTLPVKSPAKTRPPSCENTTFDGTSVKPSKRAT
jgi:hypothetical protein